ncbi:MAG: hypothetical protein EBV31_02995 [Verrucomicrobia bacterium]|nr:hypothetical protein [Verrucomicrobiota bacterium]
MITGVLRAETPKPLLAPGEGIDAWKTKREALLARWEQALGSRGNSDPRVLEDYRAEPVEIFITSEFKGVLLRQRTGPDTWQRVLLMEPLKLKGRTAGVVVPFYDPDRMCGYDLKTKARLGPER